MKPLRLAESIDEAIDMGLIEFMERERAPRRARRSLLKAKGATYNQPDQTHCNMLQAIRFKEAARRNGTSQ